LGGASAGDLATFVAILTEATYRLGQSKESKVENLMLEYRMYFAIRISKPWEDIKKSILEWFPTCPLVLYEHNVPDNIHCHMLLDYDKKEDSLRNLLKKVYNKNEYSVKSTYNDRQTGIRKPVNDSFIAYMSKGTLDPMYINVITEQVIAEQKVKGYDKGTDIVPVPEKKTQLTKSDMVALIQEQLCHITEEQCTIPYVIHVIKSLCVSKKQFQFLGMYEMIKLYDCYMAVHKQNDYISNVVAKIISRTPN